MLEFSEAALRVRHLGIIFSSSSVSFSKISLAVGNILSLWKASPPSRSKRMRSLSKLLITFLHMLITLGVNTDTSCKVLLTGERIWNKSHLTASKTRHFVSQISSLKHSNFALIFLIWLLWGFVIWLLQNSMKTGKLWIWDVSADTWCSTHRAPPSLFYFNIQYPENGQPQA